jgi:CoA:oxalate CoA-transferase
MLRENSFVHRHKSNIGTNREGITLKGALNGIKVLDLTRVLAGPYTTMLLADLGADVIKIENPEGGDDSRRFGPFAEGESVYFMSVNRNKRSLTLNLKTPEGKEVFRRLAAETDVVVENFRPGTMEKLGLHYEALQSVKKDLIYAAISGFGQTGPLSRRAAYDGVVQAMGGIMSITGEKDGRPVRVGSSVGDIITGIFCACGILAALHRRAESGEGAFVDVAMLDSIAAILENAIARYLATGADPAPNGNAHPSIFPFETFPTASRGEIMIAAGNDALWAKLCAALGREDLAADPLLRTNTLRGANHDYMYDELCKALRTKSAEEWYEVLTETGVPCSPINRVSQVVENPQIKARGMIASFEHPIAGRVMVAGNPIKIGGENGIAYRPAPVLGADTADILASVLRCGADEIAALRRAGAI